MNKRMCVRRDSALLALPLAYASQLPREGGAFYKAERADVSYRLSID